MDTSVNRKLPQRRSGDTAFVLDQDNLRVRIEQLRTRMEMYPALIFSQVVLQPLFVWMFWGQASHKLLLLWLACFYGLHAVEVVNWALHRNKLNTMQECRAWHLHFTFFALATGLLWGAAAVLFFPTVIEYQGLMICIMLGLVAGAVTMNPIHPPSLYTYILGIMVPLIFRVMTLEDAVHEILSIMLVVFLIVILVAGRGLNKTFMLSLRQRFENIDLLQQVTARKAEAEEAKRELEQANII